MELKDAVRIVQKSMRGDTVNESEEKLAFTIVRVAVDEGKAEWPKQGTGAMSDTAIASLDSKT